MLVVESIKLFGHIAALTALFGAICSLVGWILRMLQDDGGADLT